MAIRVLNIKTKRLELRNINENDTENIVSWRSDPNVFCYFLSPHAITSVEHINWYKNRYILDENRIDWMAVDDLGESVGVFGLRRESEDSDTAEINYILAHNKCGMGYAGEAIHALLIFAQSNWKCQYAIAEIHEDNMPSIKFAISQGMDSYSKSGKFITYRKRLSKKIFVRADGNATRGKQDGENLYYRRSE